MGYVVWGMGYARVSKKDSLPARVVVCGLIHARKLLAANYASTTVGRASVVIRGWPLVGKAKRWGRRRGRRRGADTRRSRGRQPTQASNSPNPIKIKSTQPQENQHPPTKHNPRRMIPRNMHNQMPQLLDRRLRFDAASVAAVVRVVRDVEVGEEDGLGGVLVICRWRLAGGRGQGRQLGIKHKGGSWVKDVGVGGE